MTLLQEALKSLKSLNLTGENVINVFYMKYGQPVRLTWSEFVGIAGNIDGDNLTDNCLNFGEQLIINCKLPNEVNLCNYAAFARRKGGQWDISFEWH